MILLPLHLPLLYPFVSNSMETGRPTPPETPVATTSISKLPDDGLYVKGVLNLTLSVFPKAHGCARFPLNTSVLLLPMFEANLLESVFQLAEVVDSEIAQLPEFMAVAIALICVLKNSISVIVIGPEN